MAISLLSKSAAAGLLLLALAGNAQAESQNRSAPAFSGTSLTGNALEFDPARQTGPTLLIFWASWCSYCMAEIPELKKLHAYGPPGLRLLGINVNLDPEDGLEVETRQRLPYPSVADGQLEISDKFGVKGTPGFVVINSRGRITAHNNRLDESVLAALAAP